MSALEIRTPRLILVLQTPEQALAWVDSLPPEVRVEVSEVWIERVRRTEPGDYWALGFDIRLHDGPPIGMLGFKGPPDGEGAVELGYGIDPDQQGQGYATEAVEALVAFALSKDKVSKVRAHTKPENTASQRVLIKCGFDRQGMVEEPEDGLVERWERSARAAESTQSG
jgi:RimJ/RimL family protein N-acetyltransferase